jgi:hypothetical protein
MVKEGCMEGVTEGVFGFHNDNMLPLGAVWIQPGVASAHCLDFEVTLRGNGGHGSMPHMSKDPLLAACSAVVALNSIVSRRCVCGVRRAACGVCVVCVMCVPGSTFVCQGAVPSCVCVDAARRRTRGGPFACATAALPCPFLPLPPSPPVPHPAAFPPCPPASCPCAAFKAVGAVHVSSVPPQRPVC